MIKTILFFSSVVFCCFFILAIYACCAVAGRADQLTDWDSKSQFEIKDMEDHL